RRVRWHRQIGEHFAAVYGGRAPEVAGELAVHFEQGRDYRRAVSYRQQAGEQALQQSAYQKALGHGWAGLALLVQLPAAAEHGHLELKLRQLVNVALAATRGYGDNDLEENLQRARQLCRELGDEAALVPVVVGLTRLHLFRANRAVTEELVKQENFLAERVHDAQLLVQLHTQLATTEMVRGRHARAADHYQQVRAHYDPQDRQLLWYSFAADPLVVAFGTSGVSVGLMGWPAQGWDRVAQGLVHAEGLAQGLTLAQALFYAAMMKNLRGERDEAWQFAQKMSALAREYELPLLARWSVLLQGGMAVQRGSAEEGVATITTALHEYRATGAQLLAPYFLSFLAEGYRQQGKIEEALQVVGEALSLTATNVDVFWEAELQRLKGTLTLQSHTTPRRATGKSKTGHRMPRAQTPEAEAEEWFLKAIEITRRQEAKLLELRAVMSLSRLWHRQGKKAEAYQLLSEIYRWFTEGFDTKDLREAEALLAEWS
ncbi:MAG TPA: hypothetical protein VGX03_04030, partial [Candidatus Binatia bacterium]|nr:hypothetical protein [Candidatus Binatia bacterium]